MYHRLSLALVGFLPAVFFGGPRLIAETVIKVNGGKQTHAADAFATLFRPYRTSAASLSPDGKYVAYSVRNDGVLSVVIAETARLDRLLTKVDVVNDDAATPTITNLREKTPGAIRWMHWVTPTRLVVETNQNFAFNSAAVGDWFNISGAIIGIDADGKNSGTLLTPKDLREESADLELPATALTPVWSPDQPIGPGEVSKPEEVVGTGSQPPATGSTSTPRAPRIFDFCADDPESVLVQAKGSRGYDIFKLNVVTGKLSRLFIETYDLNLLPLMDRQGKARVAVRTTLLTPFPHRFVYDKGATFGRWTELDKIYAAPTGPSFLISPENFFGERSIPLGFDDDASRVYYASNVGRNTFGIYSLDAKSGKKLDQVIEHPGVDLISPDPSGYAAPGTLVYDRYRRKLIGIRHSETVDTTLWLTPELEALQRRLEDSFPGETVELVEWDKGYKTFLLKIRGPSDAGGFYLFETASGKMREFVRRSPWITAELGTKTVAFAFEGPEKLRISGIITFPTSVRVRPIPMIIRLPVDPWVRVSSEYRAETEVLASMGAAVVQVNTRGVWGFGKTYLDAIKGGFEQAQIADILASVDSLAKTLPVNPKRLALVGEGRGGYLALRALQVAPTRFRCAVALEPTVDLENWIADATWTTKDASRSATSAYLSGGGKRVQEPLHRGAETITRPVMFLSYPGALGGKRTQAYLDAKYLRSAIAKHGVPVEFVELDEDFRVGLPKSRGDTYSRIEAFINEHLYAYDVKIGDTTEIKDK